MQQSPPAAVCILPFKLQFYKDLQTFTSTNKFAEIYFSFRFCDWSGLQFYTFSMSNIIFHTFQISYFILFDAPTVSPYGLYFVHIKLLLIQMQQLSFSKITFEISKRKTIVNWNIVQIWIFQ